MDDASTKAGSTRRRNERPNKIESYVMKKEGKIERESMFIVHAIFLRITFFMAIMLRSNVSLSRMDRKVFFFYMK